MAQPIIPIWVPNNLITLPSNLIYDDSNGNPVETLYPYSYLVLVGQQVNTILTNYTTLSSEVATNTTNINTLFNITSGITAPYTTPKINPLCLGNSGTTQTIDVVLAEMVSVWCAYVGVTGSQSALATAITKECANLNSSSSFANPRSSMSAIPGWVNSPATVADTLTNLWLTLCDARSGITNALNAVTPTCSQVIINFAAQVISYTSGINLFFDGYTFIPSGFSDTGSSVVVTDSAGNSYTTSINLVTLSNSTSPLNVPISGTALLPTSNYTIKVISVLTNSTLGLTCNKTTLSTVTNNIGYCPALNTTPAHTSVSYTLTPYITSNVTYVLNLYAASGGTSIATATYTNPSLPVTGTFTNLTGSTSYNIVVTTTVTGIAPYICASVPFTTTSS